MRPVRDVSGKAAANWDELRLGERSRVDGMARIRNAVLVNVDEAIIMQLRAQSRDPGRGDDALVAETLGSHLFSRTLRRVQKCSEFGEAEAARLAAEELRALRRERDRRGNV